MKASLLGGGEQLHRTRTGKTEVYILKRSRVCRQPPRPSPALTYFAVQLRSTCCPPWPELAAHSARCLRHLTCTTKIVRHCVAKRCYSNLSSCVNPSTDTHPLFPPQRWQSVCDPAWVLSTLPSLWQSSPLSRRVAGCCCRLCLLLCSALQYSVFTAQPSSLPASQPPVHAAAPPPSLPPSPASPPAQPCVTNQSAALPVLPIIAEQLTGTMSVLMQAWHQCPTSDRTSWRLTSDDSHPRLGDKEKDNRGITLRLN